MARPDLQSGFHYERIGLPSRELAPLVLLHGSGGSETSLAGFAHGIAPERAAFALRGSVPWEGGYAFFRRNPDRTLDTADLERRTADLCAFLGQIGAAGGRRPVLVGYSNGAIIAAAAVLAAPGLTSGAILVRPLSPAPTAVFPPLPAYPVLLLGGAADQRRDRADMPHLADQFRRAGAAVMAHMLPTGHAETDDDRRLARDWLANHKPR